MSKKQEAPSPDELAKLIAKKDAERRHEKGEVEPTGEPVGRKLTDKLFIVGRKSSLYNKVPLK